MALISIARMGHLGGVVNIDLCTQAMSIAVADNFLGLVNYGVQ